jgi:ubiquinone/menaquinone biosynthesis C-methylase UbiE
VRTSQKDTGILEDDTHYWEQVGAAFGCKAGQYDAFAQNHPNLARMRAKVRAHVESRLPPGARLLEINAGTGADAVYFAKRGYFIHATDLSAGMVARIKRKIVLGDLESRLSAQQVSFTQLEKIQSSQFDAVLSNLGGLNCAPDLQAITRNLPRLLKPGGLVTWVVMPPVCLWELAQALRGDLRFAFRRFKRGGLLANVEGLTVPTYYYSPRQVKAAFGSDFQFTCLEGLSVFTPPADHKEFAIHYPRLYRLLVWLDDLLADRFPWRAWGDFFILSLRYVPQSGEVGR